MRPTKHLQEPHFRPDPPTWLIPRPCHTPRFSRLTLVMLLLLLPLWHCSPSQECKGGISNLTLNADDSLCADDCDCNNQLYEGLCNKGTCITRKREACATPGAQRPCTLLPGAQVGTCTQGVQACQPEGITGAFWGDCKTKIVPEEGALCQDGKDNDCDGKTDFNDEGCPEYCGRLGQRELCYTGAPNTEGVGPCRKGTRTCQSDGTWGPCAGQVTPKPEECNEVDDDCDGKVDTGLPKCGRCKAGQTRTCYSAQAGCTEKDSKFTCQGLCRTGEQLCLSDGFWGPCQGEQTLQPEACNGKDDDCDGKIDQGVQGAALTRPCYTAELGCGKEESGNFTCLGACQAGSQVCTGGTWESQCQGAVVPQAEECDGKDNDCDGAVDEDLIGPPCEKQAGVCAGSKKTPAHCKDGKWLPCTDADYKTYNTDYDTKDESCDGKDNDCDADTDEDALLCVVTLIASEAPDYVDGPAKQARLNFPTGLAWHDDTLYIVDRGNRRIRTLRWMTKGTCATQADYTGYCVSTFAGTGKSEVVDGPRTSAAFQVPAYMIFDPKGVAYIGEANADLIRKIDTNGVTTIAGDGKCYYDKPSGKYVDCYRDGPALQAQFNFPGAFALAPSGALYIADTNNYRIRKLQEVTNAPCGINASYTGLCASTLAGDGTKATKDGPALQAQFDQLVGQIALDAKNKRLYITTPTTHQIRLFDLAKGTVSTFAGDGTRGDKDGPALQAQFRAPKGLVVDPTDDSVYVAELQGHRIRKIDTNGMVTTLAGSTRGLRDGPARLARFENTETLLLDPKGYLYILAPVNHRLWRLKVR